MTKVFISYSHDSDAHRTFVRELANLLRQKGLDCLIDQYINGSPEQGWVRWMQDEIEAADYVLVVCTAPYYRRFRGHEVIGGLGVNFEGVVIAQVLYQSYYKNSKFIPIIPDGGDLKHVPETLRIYTVYQVHQQFDQLYRVLTGQAKYQMPDIGRISMLPNITRNLPPRSIHSDNLPKTRGQFFGRNDELQLLNECWEIEAKTNIVQFIAPGGTGKTKMLKHWLDNHPEIPVMIAWSFYSQGASEDRQESAAPFFAHAFKALGCAHSDFKSENEKGYYLAELLRQQPSVLVLDGLEPMQYASEGLRGEIKDRALSTLLSNLANQNPGLCIITTRISVNDIADRERVVSHDLQNLNSHDGAKLLSSLGVKGEQSQLQLAATEYAGHALALQLLGNVLRIRYGGNVDMRDRIAELPVSASGKSASRHAFKVMQAYEEWFADQAELAVLKLMSLFDHPVDQNVLETLWKEAIPDLTTEIEPDSWYDAIDALRTEHGLITEQVEKSNQLDCHPLFREYFSQQLKHTQPTAWKQANSLLYEYYKNLPSKELPETIDELQPLYRAIAHGCAAGEYTRTLEDVFWERINRKDKFYSSSHLRAFSHDLSAFAHFYTQYWDKPVTELNQLWHASLLNWTAFALRALGRLQESLEPFELANQLAIDEENWNDAASGVSSLSELWLSLGNIEKAISIGEDSVRYADLSERLSQQIARRTVLGDILHKANRLHEASRLFNEAEDFQKQYEPHRPLLHTQWGFRYCDLLLTQGKVDKVFKRLKYACPISHSDEFGPLSQALDQLMYAQAYYHEAQSDQQCREWLDKAISALDSVSHQHYLPRALLLSAALERRQGNTEQAEKTLKTIYHIAEPSNMFLHMTDYHLESARLGLEMKKDKQSIQLHIDGAETLINDTGYHQRDNELAELKVRLPDSP